MTPLEPEARDSVAETLGGAPRSWLGAILIVVAATTPVLAYLGNLGFAPLIGLAGAASLPLALRRNPASLGSGLLLVLVAWALASLAWSPAAPHAFKAYHDLETFTGLKLVLQLALYGSLVVAARGATPRLARITLLVLGVGVAMAMFLVVEEGVRGAPLYRAIKALAHQYTRPDLARRNVARASYAAVLLIWPTGLVLVERRWTLVLLALGVETAAAAVLLNVDAPLAALLIGGVFFLVVRCGGRLGAWILAAAVVLYFAAAPMVFTVVEHALPARAVSDAGKASWGARLEIWRFAVDRIGEHPFRGWGLDASRVFPGVIPLHPHDAALQIWLELGAPGAALAASFFGWTLTRIAALRSRDADLAACAAGTLGAYLVVGALSFGVWQEWWLALGALAIVAVELAAATRRERPADAIGALQPLEVVAPSRRGPAGV